MTDGSFDTNPSSEPYTNQYLQIVKDSNLSNCFFKFLFNVEEDNKAQKKKQNEMKLRLKELHQKRQKNSPVLMIIALRRIAQRKI